MGKSERVLPDFILNKDEKVINLLKTMSPNAIIKFVADNPDIFAPNEVHVQIIRHGFELQNRLLEHGGIIYTRDQEVYINGDRPPKNMQNGRRILPNLRGKLGYGFSRPDANLASSPIFFQVEEDGMTLFEREHNLLRNVLGDLYAKNRLPTPRLSSTSLTNQNLMHIANKYGKGRIK